MKNEKLIAFLLSTGVVTPATATEIADEFNIKEIKKGDYFLKEGRVSNEYLFLADGCMRAFAIDTEGNEVTTNFYAANQVVFEVSSFFNRTIARENIQAITDCNGWCISYDQLNRLFHALPEFRDFGRLMLVRGFASLKTRMLAVITETAEHRYEHLLQNSPGLFQYAQLKHIASWLGITDTSLSRIRKEFAKHK